MYIYICILFVEETLWISLSGCSTSTCKLIPHVQTPRRHLIPMFVTFQGDAKHLQLLPGAGPRANAEDSEQIKTLVQTLRISFTKHDLSNKNGVATMNLLNKHGS